MRWRGTNNVGLLLLGIWLILTGLLPFLHINYANTGVVLSVLAIIAGSLIVLDR